MKKFIPLLLTTFAIAFASCERDSDVDKLGSKYLVYTDYDTKADFRASETYYLPDSILVIGSSKGTEYQKDESAQEVLNAYVTSMNNCSYVRVDKRETADLGLQVSYVKSTYYFTDYGHPEQWWSYPGYWDVPYWGNWDGWCYPYTVNYACNTGSSTTGLLNLNASQGEKEKLPVLRTSYMNGLLNGLASSSTKMAVEGVNQAFTQSAYFNRMSAQSR